MSAIVSPTIIYENNVACVGQMQMGYIKTNYIKYISPKLFYPHQPQESREINIFYKLNHAIISLIYLQSFHFCDIPPLSKNN
jgi:hypothetical protein